MLSSSGYLWVMFGMVLKALYEVGNKKLGDAKVSSDLIGTYNFLVAGGALVIYACSFTTFDLSSVPRLTAFLWAFVPTALLNVVIQYGNIRALQFGHMSLISPIGAAQPMIVVIPSMMILGEWPTVFGYAGMVMLASGLYVYAVREDVYETSEDAKTGKRWSPPWWLGWSGRFAYFFAPIQMLFRNRGVQIAFTAACCGAVSINFDKLAIVRSSAPFASGMTLLFCGLWGLPKVLKHRAWETFPVDPKLRQVFWRAPAIFALMIVSMATALHYGHASYVGAFKRTQPLVSLTFAYLFLGERQAVGRWPAVMLMVLGAILLAF